MKKFVLLALACGFLSMQAHAQFTYSNIITIANPNWEISISDYGYSDYLGDLTPGFEGREYLSGEWGAAVGYTRGGDSPVTVSPTWMEPVFIFPDWNTNSNFTVVSGIAVTGTNADGLEIAQSVISNGDLQITIGYEMIDTVFGMAMGNTAASFSGAAASVESNRYVLKQSYKIENVSGEDITNLQLYQLIHDLNGQSGVYDNRAYAGAMSQYRYDTTLGGIDPGSVGQPGSSSEGFKDYISFGAALAPSAFELGYYGIQNGVSGDNHVLGKPSVGVHLSIEDGDLNGTDSFAPALPWVGGAESWNLGTLTDGSSLTFDLVLSIRTGTQVALGGTQDPETGGSGGDGSAGGGSGHVGGCDFQFEHVEQEGEFYFEFSLADLEEIELRIGAGEFEAIDFTLAGSVAQLWELEFEGQYTGDIFLTFAYDPLLLGDLSEGDLAMFHFDGGGWENLGGVVDTELHTITIVTSSLSPFMLGAEPVPEPSAGLLILGFGSAVFFRRRRAKCNRGNL